MRSALGICLALAILPACTRYVDSTDLADVEQAATLLDVTGTLGHLTVTGRDGGPVHIERVVHAAEGSYPSETHVVDQGIVRIKSRCDEAKRCEMRHRVDAPRELPVNVDLDVAYVEIKGMRGPLQLDLESGNIDVVDARSPAVKARVGAGDIDLVFVEAPKEVSAEIDVGTLTIAVPEGSYRCEIDEELVHTEIERVKCDDAAPNVIRARVEVGSLRLVGR